MKPHPIIAACLLCAFPAAAEVMVIGADGALRMGAGWNTHRGAETEMQEAAPSPERAVVVADGEVQRLLVKTVERYATDRSLKRAGVGVEE